MRAPFFLQNPCEAHNALREGTKTSFDSKQDPEEVEGFTG